MQDREILELARRVVTGELDVADFEDRMITDAWNDDSLLSCRVWLILAETSGNATNTQVIEQLRGLTAAGMVGT